MNAIEQARFTPLFESMQRALKLQGKAKATKDAYSRGVRRTAEYFDLGLPDTGLLSYAEMRVFCESLPGPKMASMLEEGVTSVLPPVRLQEMGYKIAAYPLTLLNTAVFAMEGALADLEAGRTPTRRVDFAAVRDIVGFDAYDQLLGRYAGDASGS